MVGPDACTLSLLALSVQPVVINTMVARFISCATERMTIKQKGATPIIIPQVVHLTGIEMIARCRSSERLSPNGVSLIVWVDTIGNDTQSLGQLWNRRLASITTCSECGG